MRLVEEVGFKKSPIDENYYREALTWAEKYLLRQGPLEYFVHHNTLHSFETKPFLDALFEAKDLYQAKTHMSLNWYAQQFKEKRITQKDLQYAISKNFDKDFEFSNIFNWNGNLDRLSNVDKEQFLKSFEKDIRKDSQKHEKEFYQVETYWGHSKSKFRSSKIKRNLENLRLKFLSAFFDKGTSYWEMEDKELGLNHCFALFLGQLPKTSFTKFILKSYEVLRAQEGNIFHSLEIFKDTLEVPEEHFKTYLFQIFNQTKGWTGLVLSLNENENFNPTKINADKNEYFLLCLTFELAGYLYLKKNNELNDFLYTASVSNDHLSDILSFLYDDFFKIGKRNEDIQILFRRKKAQLQQLTYKKIIKVWQEAYEAHLYFQLINTHSQTPKIDKVKPIIQVITCIDDREESTRRHFEEYSSEIETYGYAGHFGLNIKYRSLRDAHFRALCPVNANPDKYVYEELLPGEKVDFKVLAKIKHFLFHNSNLPFLGSFLSLLIGPFTGMLFLFESINPKGVHRLRKRLKKNMYPPVRTRLNYLNEGRKELKGFSNEELATAGFNLISVTGINKNFTQIVYLCGHGSKSMNNPHEAAYNCGACAGGKGAPNARLMATALNDPEVRLLIGEKGISIPKETIFVGGYHCTSTGKLLIFDQETLSNEQTRRLRNACDYVEKHESKERMRKFENVPLTVSVEEAFLAAQNRSYDFSQPRPEYGHNTNAFCLVGKRATSENLFLDRRAFLVSYDEENDKQGDNLLSLLSAVIPVCAGISLEYYFSFVDQQKFGAGVKQAHNVTSLMGVMNGYQSDLQMGLPWQMVEIHEPARITFLIEAEPEKFERVMAMNQEVKNLVDNEWVLLILKTAKGDYLLYGKGEVRPLSIEQISKIPRFAKSEDIYTGKRKILDLAIKGER